MRGVKRNLTHTQMLNFVSNQISGQNSPIYNLLDTLRIPHQGQYQKQQIINARAVPRIQSNLQLDHSISNAQAVLEQRLPPPCPAPLSFTFFPHDAIRYGISLIKFDRSPPSSSCLWQDTRGWKPELSLCAHSIAQQQLKYQWFLSQIQNTSYRTPWRKFTLLQLKVGHMATSSEKDHKCICMFTAHLKRKCQDCKEEMV